MTEPKPMACHYCDFSSGQRGMDRCSRCKGTGSVLLIAGPDKQALFYPNTKEGWDRAVNKLAELNATGGSDGR